MRLLKSRFILALVFIAVLGSLRAFSDFSKEEPAKIRAAYEAKKNYYLESPEVPVEETEVDENFIPLLADETDEPDGEEAAVATDLDLSENEPLIEPSAVPSQAIGHYNKGSLKNASQLEMEGPGFKKRAA